MVVWSELANTIRAEAAGVIALNPIYATSWLRVVLYSATTGPEDYATLNLKMRMPEDRWEPERLPWGVAKHPEVWGTAEEWYAMPSRRMARSGAWPVRCAKQFARGDTGDGEVLQMTVTTVYEVLQREPNEWEQELMDSNYAHAQWSVASYILGLNCTNPLIPELMQEAGMFKVPLFDWIEHYKEWTNALRRVCAVWEDATVTQEEWMGVRKMLNCADRVREEADWEKELRRRTGELPSIVGLRQNGMVQDSQWLRTWHKHAERVTAEAVSQVNDSMELEGMDSWMRARWAHMPTGSTSIRQVVSGVFSTDARLPKAARPSKKTTSEAMPCWLLAFIIAFIEPMVLVRTSTKEEPQRKLRALYAICCISSLVASFASVHIEKFITAEGIRAKQAPADVLDWVRAGVMTRNQEQWLSVDYTDWNWQIMQIVLVMLNLSFADAWRKQYTRDKNVGLQKSLAATWIAYSHAAVFATFPQGEYRLLGTLCSGHRDTARDNCTIHGINKAAVVEMTNMFDNRATPAYMLITGDDEDGKFYDLFAAASYLMSVLICMFDLNASKQLGGRWTHEFLQRMARKNDLPTMPMWAALAQYASGNWYKDVTIWFDTSVQSCSDNAYELHRRGMPLVYARRLAASTLNAMMRIPKAQEAGYKKLEWWSYRQNGNAHPLWCGTDGPNIACPRTPSECAPRVPVQMQKASWDWLLSRKERLRLPIPEEKEDALIRSFLEKSYAKMFEKVRGAAQREIANTAWPERANEPEYSTLHLPGTEERDTTSLLHQMLATFPDRRPTTLEEVLMRMGLDIELVEAAGGLMQVYKHLPPEQQCKFEQPITVVQLPMNVMHADAALLATMTQQAGVRLPAHDMPDMGRLTRAAKRLAAQGPMKEESKFVPATVVVLLAPNAAGKTTWTHQKPHRIDMDTVVSSEGMKKQMQNLARSRVDKFTTTAARLVERQILRNAATAIATQWPVHLWLPKPSRRGYRVLITVWDPPKEELERRMLARGWKEMKIARRLDRWESTKTSLQAHAATVLTPEERDEIVYHMTTETPEGE